MLKIFDELLFFLKYKTNEKIFLWGALYLDKHGETDPHFQRMKPLYLDESRFEQLQTQWHTQTYSTNCKHWENFDIKLFGI